MCSNDEFVFGDRDHDRDRDRDRDRRTRFICECREVSGRRDDHHHCRCHRCRRRRHEEFLHRWKGV